MLWLLGTPGMENYYFNKGGTTGMKQNLLKCLLAVSVFCLFLTGCNGNISKEDSSSEETSQNNGKNQGKEKVTLSIWAGEEDKEYITAVTQKFIKEYEKDADINIEWSPVVEGQCRTALLNDVLNGADLYTTTDGDIQTIVAGGAASPVINPEEIRTSNIKSAVDAVTIYGTIYGYPITADNGYFLYYNKKYLSSEDVKSLDKILEIAAKNKKKFAMDWTSGWYLYSFYGQTGLKVGLNKDGVTNFCTWNSIKNSIKGVDVANALLEIGRNPGFKNTTEWIKGIQDGSVIACVSGVWDESLIKDMLGNNYAATKLPTYTVAGKQIQMACYFGYKMLGVNPYSKNLDWAHKLAAYISNEENQKLRFEIRGQGPSNINASKDNEIMQSQAVQAVLAQSEFSELQRLGGNYWDPVTEFGKLMASGSTGGKNLQSILDNMVKMIKASTVG